MATRDTARPADRASRPIRLPAPSPTIVPATDLGGVGLLKHGNLYLLSDQFGDVHPDSRGLGLYDLDTRVLSCAVLRINGERLTLLGGHVGAGHAGTIYLTNPDRRSDPSPKMADTEALAMRAISITRRRWIAGGLAERIRITNYSPVRQQVRIDLELDADAADIFEVRGRARERRGRFLPTEATREALVFAYEGLDGLVRRTRVAYTTAVVTAARELAGAPATGSVRLSWTLDVEPGSHGTVRWDVTTDLQPGDGGERHGRGASVRRGGTAPPAWPATARATTRVGDPGATDAEYRAWQDGCAGIQSDSELLDLVVRRSISDLRLLRNDGPGPGEHYLAAGVPWFTTLFGRDGLITALQVLPFMPEVARETLAVLAARQATETDPARDMEPGKILHELRVGELARTGELPHRPYYGSVDATPLWLILLEETYRWTGDVELIRRLWPNALAALAWIDGPGDRDGDGFVEYERRSPSGLLNQGWKDSGDALPHRDGGHARAPIALAEVQGYVFDAKRRMASLAGRLGDPELSGRLLREANELRQRFDDAFWLPDEQYYAMALDGEKRQVATIGSNAGHCLWSGIIPPERVDAVVDRLLDPSMDSGWGIRTYAAGQPGYNPVSYHAGSVWPHDNALIAAGMKRAGRHDAAARVASRMVEAARLSPDFRLPELFCGFDRGVAEAPVPYPVACSPQAWSAATPLSLLRTMLGLEADAARGILELDQPGLPDWLGRVTVQGLRVGDRRLDLLVDRRQGATSAEVLQEDGPIELLVRA